MHIKVTVYRTLPKFSRAVQILCQSIVPFIKSPFNQEEEIFAVTGVCKSVCVNKINLIELSIGSHEWFVGTAVTQD